MKKFRSKGKAASYLIALTISAGCQPSYTQVVIQEDGKTAVDAKHSYNNILPKSEIARFERLAKKAIPGNASYTFIEQHDAKMYTDETFELKMWCGVVDIEGRGKRNFGYVVMQNRQTKQKVANFSADKDTCVKSFFENKRDAEYSAIERFS